MTGKLDRLRGGSTHLPQGVPVGPALLPLPSQPRARHGESMTGGQGMKGSHQTKMDKFALPKGPDGPDSAREHLEAASQQQGSGEALSLQDIMAAS